MLFSLLVTCFETDVAGISTSASGGSQTVTRVADPSTMDNYTEALNLDQNSRRAGRIWADKSVFARDVSGESWNGQALTLDTPTDGLNTQISLAADGEFLHAFSALGSSQEYSGKIPSNVVIVIDNSGSMYGNSKVWEETRADKTIKAVNSTIDKLMRAHSCNQVAVVLFGNGYEGTPGEERNRMDNHDTAVTIVKMRHYAYSSDPDKPYQYLSAGWKNGASTVIPASPLQDTAYASGNGFVYVNSKYITTDGKVAAGGDNYTEAYSNGTTNIHAGIYAGFQELMNAKKKSTTFGDIVVEHVPSLVLLSDGEASDMLDGNWFNPVAGTGTMKARIFNNPPGNKHLSYLHSYNATDTAGGTFSFTEKLTSHWDMFVELVPGTSYYRQLFWKPNNGNSLVTSAAGYSNSAGVTVEDTSALKELYRGRKEAESAMLLGSLMTAGYMKAAVQKAYNKECSVYTISMDVPNLKDVNVKDGHLDAYGHVVNADAYEINTSNAVMNPAVAFSTDFLKKAGYMEAGGSVTVYEEYTVGQEFIHAIADAYNDWIDWKNGVKSELTYTYRAWSETSGLYKTMRETYPGDANAKQYAPIGPSHDNAYVVSPAQEITIGHLTSDSSTNPYGLRDSDIDVNYVSENGAFFASSADAAGESVDSVFDKIVAALNQKTFSPVGGINDFNVGDALTYNDPIGEYMEVKNVSNLILFGNNYAVGKTALYDYRLNRKVLDQTGESTFISGWYTEEGVKLEGDNANWANGNYYLDRATALTFVPTLPDVNAALDDRQREKLENTVYTFYRITGKYEADGTLTPTVAGESDIIVNPSYGYKDANGDNKVTDDEKIPANAKVTFDLKSIRIWVEDSEDWVDPDVSNSGMETTTDYDEALHINIPTNALPIQVATMEIDDPFTLKCYSTNIKDVDGQPNPAALPLRLFYSVGVADSVLTSDKSAVDIAKLSTEYLNAHRVSNITLRAPDGSDGDTGGALYNKGYTSADVGKVEFYSNWYNPANRYTNYVSVNQPNGYTFGDATVTFSPNVENRYYLFQKALPLYALTADEVKEGETPPELDLGSVDVQFDENGQPKPGGNGQNEVYTEFLNKHKRVDSVGEGANQLASDKWYYVVLEYYRSANESDTDIPKNSDGSYKGLMVRTAVPRKGSEFGSGIAGGTETVETASYLAWYYTGESYNGVLLTEEERTSTFYPAGGADLSQDEYDEYGKPLQQYRNDPAGEQGDWIIAARKGGIRSGDLAQNVIPKSGDWQDKESIYANNYTYTANNVMLPTISTYTEGDGTGKYDDNVIVNVYLGNNGRMTVQDTLLLVTKTVELGNEDVAMTDAQDTYKQFHYQVTIEGFTGVHSAIEIQVNPNSNKWQRRFSTIDVLTDNNDMLQSIDAALISTDGDGNRLYTATEYNYQFGSSPAEPADPESASGYYNADGTPFEGKRFYVYCGRNSSADDAGESASDHTLRIYSNAENNATLYRGGYTTYVDPATSSQRPTSNPDGVWYGQILKPSRDGHLPGVTEFWIRDVYLVPAEDVDGGLWDDPDTKPVYHSDGADSYLGDTPERYKKLTQYVAATLDPYVEENADDSFVSLTSPYLIRGEYLLREVNFGIPASQMYDQNPITVGGKTLTAAEAAQNTAQFTLSHNTGLLFRGIENGAVYRTTEKLSDKLGDGTYALSRLEHYQHDSFADYRPIDSDPSKENYQSSGAQLWEAYAIDRNDPDTDPEYYYRNGKDVNDAGKKLNASALFRSDPTGAEGPTFTYSAFGDTSEIEETVRYYNLYNPVPLKIEKLLANGTELRVEPQDFDRAFTFQLKLTGPSGGGEGEGTEPEPLRGSYLFRFYDKMTEDAWNAIEYETLSEEAKRGYDPQYHGKLVREETLPLDETGTAAFKLKGNQYVIIWGLSIGQWYEYSLSENDPIGWDPNIQSEDISSSGGESKNTTFRGYLGRSENPSDPVENDRLNITNTKSKPTYELATLLGKKIVNGDAYSMAGNNFSFVIEPFADNPEDDPFHGEPRTVSNGPDGALTFFSEELFPATLSDDIYQYTVREEHRDITGMLFDSSVYLITVRVQKIPQLDGSHIARPVITAVKRAGPREPKEEFPLQEPTNSTVTVEGASVNVWTYRELLFENDYTKNPTTRMLRIQKQVEPFDDRFGDNEFTFRIRFTGTSVSAIHWQKFAKDGSLLGNAPVDLNASGEMIFTLRHGDTIEFTNIIAGTQYEVEEINREGFNLQRVERTVGADPPKIGHDLSVRATLDDHDETVAFVNAPGLTAPFSGGLGWTPWYMLGAVLFALPPVIYYLCTKRRRRFM